MEFCRYIDPLRYLKRLGAEDEYIDDWGKTKESNVVSKMIRSSYENWLSISRPFYRVYPSIEELLLTSDLSVTGDVFFSNSLVPVVKKLKGWSIAVEFSKESQVINRCVMISIIKGPGEFTREDFHMVMHYVDEENGDFICSSFSIGACTLEESIEMASKHGDSAGVKDEALSIFRVFVGACMLANDPMLIEPIVLNRDAIKYKKASVEQRHKMEERASRLNGRGWAIGKGFEEQCETSPHFRKSHLALFWTGKGRSIPKLQLRKGCLVKSRKVVEIPTGHYEKP